MPEEHGKLRSSTRLRLVLAGENASLAARVLLFCDAGKRAGEAGKLAPKSLGRRTMGISKVWGKAVVVAGCLGVMASAAHAGYDENVGAATDSSSSNMGGSMSGMSRSDMRMHNAQMLIQTLSEEKTEIGALAAQREMFLRMGGTENRRIARLWLRWINEHKAGGPTFMRLIRLNGGDPMEAHVLKAPPLGSRAFMLMATHKDHVAAVMTSQMRFNMTMSPSVKAAMHKRANLARKHLVQMMRFDRDRIMNGGMSSGINGNMGGMDNSSMDNSANSSTTTTTTTNTTTNSTSVGTPDTSTTDNSTDNSTTSSTDTTTSSDAAGTVENSTSSGDSNSGGLATGTNDAGNGSANNSGADTGGLTTGTNDGTSGTTDNSGADVGGLQSGTNDSGNGTMNGQ
jgi:hypothetical protein